MRNSSRIVRRSRGPIALGAHVERGALARGGGVKPTPRARFTRARSRCSASPRAIHARPCQLDHHEPVPARAAGRQLGAVFSSLAPALKTTISPGVRGSQTSDAMHIDQTLPGKELLNRKHVPTAGLVQANAAAANGRHHLCLTLHGPALGIRWRQMVDGYGRIRCFAHDGEVRGAA